MFPDGLSEVLARRGGEGGFDRRIVDAEHRQHLPGIGAPRHGEFGPREGAVVLFRRGEGAGIGLASCRRSAQAPCAQDFPAPGGGNR